MLSEVLYQEFDSADLLTSIKYLDKIQYYLGSSLCESEMKKNLLELHHLIVESQKSKENVVVEDILNICSSIGFALTGMIKEVEKLREIIHDLDHALDIASAQIEENKAEEE